ncbi:hypothetical protein BEWA_013480 [Theileria equi strain WA]|uniref:Uncharacterized protein n=1 Tax=Theileria equi strain WA TaxID=1537102 RepID=L1LBZ2_THEEQ|nr:hypothetical protein BEWA_013480 [Theileria equi strain WA]EKX72789.1 hypothetical protein BEWA_013480 [Theileria equi strain WA]|eukprot:XP_004832241.1 hypothetical protein BEWA_013480 [Theileria equi strain WA]
MKETENGEALEDQNMIEEDILAYGRKNLHPTLLENVLKQYKKFSKVQRRPKNEQEIPYIDEHTGGRKFTVKRSEEPSGSGFYKYTYEDRDDIGGLGNKPFELSEIQDDTGNSISGIPSKGSDKKVTSVSAYYWKHESTNGSPPTKVLLVEVVYSGENRTAYYVRGSGKDWIETSLQNDLEKTLYEQNCYNNEAVTLDLTRSNSETHSKHGGTGYCCAYHKEGPKVTVEEIAVRHQHERGESTKLYKHTIYPTSKLAGIKYNEGGNHGPKSRKNIKIPGLDNSGKDSVDIYALYSGKNQDPELIYVKSTGDSGVTGWFKKGSSNNGNWEKAEKLDKNITPNNFGDLDCDKFKALKEELNHDTSGLDECKEHLKQQERAQLTARTELGGEQREESREEEQEEEKKEDEDSPKRDPGPPGSSGKNGDGDTGASDDRGTVGARRGSDREAQTTVPKSGDSSWDLFGSGLRELVAGVFNTLFTRSFLKDSETSISELPKNVNSSPDFSQKLTVSHGKVTKNQVEGFYTEDGGRKSSAGAADPKGAHTEGPTKESDPVSEPLAPPSPTAPAEVTLLHEASVHSTGHSQDHNWSAK